MYRAEFERLLANIAARFINLPAAEMSGEMPDALKCIGEFAGVDRVSLLSLADDGSTKAACHWSRPGVAPLTSGFTNGSASDYPWWLQRRKRFETIHVPRVEALPADGAGRAALQAHGIQSMLEVPMIAGASLIGLLGWSSDTATVWSSDDIALLKMAGEMFASALHRQQVEREHAELEDRVRRSQQLDAVGRLAGGLAHDFNNQLTVIKGSAQFLLEGLKASDPLRKDAERIRATVDRGAQLVRQLLAFSRRQCSEPEVLNMNDVLKEIIPMLRAMLSEHIELQVQVAPALWPVVADRGQLEQVLVNLTVNAKDAVLSPEVDPRRALITLGATNVGLDPSASVLFGEPVDPGGYVMLTIGDTGCGMTTEVQERLFEPFFTTKKRGKGTGLGLSTVFGIIRQHRGHVSCASEPGVGTTFRVYLRRATDALAAAGTNLPGHSARDGLLSGGISAREEHPAVVLVAEDEQDVREIIRRALEHARYRVHVAGSVPEAVVTAAQLADPIDLLVTDLSMPGGSGKILAEMLSPAHPAMKVLYVSGYLDAPIDKRGTCSARLLHKPFSIDSLLRDVRELLAES